MSEIPRSQLPPLLRKQTKGGRQSRPRSRGLDRRHSFTNYSRTPGPAEVAGTCMGLQTSLNSLKPRARKHQAVKDTSAYPPPTPRSPLRTCPGAILYYTILYSTILYHTIPYYAILCHTILYYTIPYYTILNHTIPYYTIPYYTILYYTIPYYTIPYYTIPYHTVLYDTIRCYTILYYAILYYTILYSTLLYYTILYHTIPYHTILYYTIPYHTIPYYTRLDYTEDMSRRSARGSILEEPAMRKHGWSKHGLSRMPSKHSRIADSKLIYDSHV